MRIAIILEHKENANPTDIMESVSKGGNVEYLAKGEGNPNFPYLSQVESYDHAVFSPLRMDGIIKELLVVRDEVADSYDKAHIDDIIRLAERCKNTPDTVLVFAG